MPLEQYKDVPIAVLRRSAVEDFAVVVEDGDKKPVVVKNLEESGVTWETFLQVNPEYAPVVEEEVVVEARETEPTRAGDVISTDVLEGGETVEVLVEKPVIRMAQPLVPDAQAEYLVVMDRENPYFEFENYKFYKDNPYNIMTADATDRILTEEEGFRIATPSEFKEFYA